MSEGFCPIKSTAAKHTVARQMNYL
uniref:Uncharacterized protein n=1 Tax=Anguilla anguilla TaxID=7936 RepID=A0A0E9UR57_ANGAN